MKRCELCKAKARMHCESDQAILCWDCDAKVHSANFLVARHSRNLLCRLCQSPTPWSASGAKLGPTFSVCPQCANGRTGDESGDEEEDEVAEAEAEAEVIEENQVVPWSPPPPPEESSSSDESVDWAEVAVSRKRCKIENASDEDHAAAAGMAGWLSGRKRTPLQKYLMTESDRVCKFPGPLI